MAAIARMAAACGRHAGAASLATATSKSRPANASGRRALALSSSSCCCSPVSRFPAREALASMAMKTRSSQLSLGFHKSSSLGFAGTARLGFSRGVVMGGRPVGGDQVARPCRRSRRSPRDGDGVAAPATAVAAAGYKLKTHKASAKRFRVTGSGKIQRRRAGKQHLLMRKTTKRRKRLSKMSLVKICDSENITKALPYLKVAKSK
ncbi:hypothetical protein CBR_g46223 [Chara braunii]|uniref:50S ribosomal protein L35 n=1 Tax=Chara braunii TaxID=69332 RepID=A0A388K3R2_CHABU|nr:hypothetical protein CBR_g46223 [Chara braunii]|eukprot:GBG64681.1 hypothetical protein CBR_g46223 [Chara braunii]